MALQMVQVALFEPSLYTHRVVMTFGDRLKAQRVANGLTQFALSQLSGIRESVIYSIEKGTRPASEDNLRKLAEVQRLNITYEKLRVWQMLGKSTMPELTLIAAEIQRMAKELQQKDLSP